MKKILFLSSAFIMTTLGAYAADGIITGGAGTCTVDVLGVSDNNATANTIATWSLNDYECGAGQYLDEDTLTCTTCPAGSYCPGGTFTIENASSGTFDCPAGYTESAAGAGTNNECYTACTVANANIEHATAVAGNDYYGTTDADTCAATDCELGYQVDGELQLIQKAPIIDVDTSLVSSGYVYIDKNGNPDNHNGDYLHGDVPEYSVEDAGLTENNTFAALYDNGVIYGRAVCQPTVDPAYDYVKTQGGVELLGTMLNAGGVDAAKTVLDNFRSGLEPLAGKAKTDFIVKHYEMAYEMALGGGDAGNIYRLFIDTQVIAPSIFWADEDIDHTNSMGKYCYCQVTDYAPNGGTKSAIVGAPWMLDGNIDDNSGSVCVDDCVRTCVEKFRLDVAGDGDVFRNMMLGAYDYRIVGGMCKVTETDCPAGQYLAVVGDAMMCVPCKSGSYCPGGVYTIESENKGTNACPAGYAQSDEGASANTQCYKACTLETANIAHATAVGGNDYYGTGTDTCTATACDTGYHVKGNITVFEKEPLVDVDYINPADSRIGFGFITADGTDWRFWIDDEVDAKDVLTGNNTWGHVFNEGIVYGRASCQPTLDPGLVYIDNIYSVINGSMTMAEFRAGFEPIVGKVKADFVEDLFARAMSGAISMDEAQAEIYAVFNTFKDADFKTTDVGQYCHCQIDGFAEFTGEPALENLGAKTPVSSAPWIYLYYYSTSDECSKWCASNCAGDTQSYLMHSNNVTKRILRTTLYGALDYTEETATCAANTINIDWNPDNGGAHTQNMCTYDGSITLPDEPVKVGYTFSGWKLVEPNSTPVQ